MGASEFSSSATSGQENHKQAFTSSEAARSVGEAPVLSKPATPNSQVGAASGNGSFTAECGRLGRQEWDSIVTGFQDAGIYQTWSYAAVRWGEKNVQHLLLKQGSSVVGAAQVIVLKVPLLPAGLAYVKWGPLWMPRGMAPNPLVFREMLRALREEYAHKRGLLLRVNPWEFADSEFQTVDRFQRGVTFPNRTVELNLTYSMEELRTSLTRHWRANLKKAEANSLEVVENGSEQSLAEFVQIYGEMRRRKKEGWIPPIPYLIAVQQDLSPNMRAFVSIVRHKGRPVAGLVVSALGEKAFAWLAATGNSGYESRGSYLVQWRMIERLKAAGMRSYDLGGINEVTHPGPAQFKLGLCGKLGRAVDYVGEFSACESLLSRAVIGGTDPLRMALLRVQQFFEERRLAHETQVPESLTQRGSSI